MYDFLIFFLILELTAAIKNFYDSLDFLIFRYLKDFLISWLSSVMEIPIWKFKNHVNYL